MRPRRYPFFAPCLVAIWLALSGACHKSSSGAPVPPLVVTTLPRDGATDVEPDVAVILDLESPMEILTAADVIVSDGGGNRLPGTVQRIDDTASWSWTPDYELPRRSQIVIATARQGVVATFTVRDIVLAGMLEVPGEYASAAFSWPNGRRAVRTSSGRVFEVVASSLVERFVTLSPDASTYGDGGFITYEEDGGVHYCVRGNLDGNFDRVPLPEGAQEGSHNARGDVVVFVPNAPATMSYSGLWRLFRAEASFAPAGPLAVEPIWTRHAGTIEPDGTVSLAYVESGVVRLSRFPPGDLVGQHHDLAMTAGVTLGRVHYDASADGRGVLVVVLREPASLQGSEEDVVQVARFEPGSGLRYLSFDVYRRPLSTGGVGFTSFRAEAHVGDWGAACVELSTFTSNHGIGSQWWRVVRVEANGRVTTAVPLMGFNLHPSGQYDPQGHAGWSPLRGEAWAMKFYFSQIDLTRSRPGAAVDLTVFSGDSHPWGVFAFDDSGRAVAAWTSHIGPVSTRIQLWD